MKLYEKSLGVGALDFIMSSGKHVSYITIDRGTTLEGPLTVRSAGGECLPD